MGIDVMEVYYKELISADASLDKLIDELTRVVQGADELAEAARAHLPQEATREISTRLDRLKESCNRLKEHGLAGAAATDKILRRHPYSSVGIAFGLGILAAAIFVCGRRRGDAEGEDD
jgi:ElaB/YqjD/DUF883 family membrane-anchored ribosome-binding protein